MPNFDDRLTRELERAARPADPTGVFDRIDRRRTRRRRARKLQAGALVVVVLAGTATGFGVLSRTFQERGPGVGSAPGAENGLIIYSEVRNAGQQLWVVNADGTGARQLTDGNGASDSSPAVSPNGRTVAFVRTEIDGPAIYTIDIEGGSAEPLTPPGWFASDPAWAPDGRRIAFVGNAGDGFGLYVMAATLEGAAPHKIAGDQDLAPSDPAWSPDGARITFSASAGPPSDAGATNYDLWTIDATGANPTQITSTTGASEVWPSWSPDGSRILFARGSSTSTSSESGNTLMTIGPALNATPVALTDGSNVDQNPTWSPDGQLIVFDRSTPAGSDVYTMRPDGSQVTLVAQNATDPAWQPVLADGAMSPNTDVRVGAGAWRIVIAYGSVWVSEPGAVVRVDELTGQVLTEIPVAHMDESDIAAGGGRVWVTTVRGTVIGIDPATNAIDRTFEIETGIHTVTYADGGLYVGQSAEGNGTLDEIDPSTGGFRREIVTGGAGLADSAILSAGDAYWVGYSSPDLQGNGAGLVRVSSDFSLAETVKGVDQVFSIAEADGFIWAVGTGALYQVAFDGTLVRTLDYPRAGKVTSDGTNLWLLMNTGSTSDKVYLPDPSVPTRVVEVDTHTGALIGQGVALLHNVPANIAAADGYVWVSFYDDGILTRLPISSSSG